MTSRYHVSVAMAKILEAKIWANKIGWHPNKKLKGCDLGAMAEDALVTSQNVKQSKGIYETITQNLIVEIKAMQMTQRVVLPSSLAYDHYYKKYFARRFEISLRGGQHFQPPRLMVGINRGGHFLLTKAVMRTPHKID